MDVRNIKWSDFPLGPGSILCAYLLNETTGECWYLPREGDGYGEPVRCDGPLIHIEPGGRCSILHREHPHDI